MANEVPDRSQVDRSVPSVDTSNMIAKCGHEDMLGYFAGTVCGKCVRKNHKKAMGR
jgi:hypothetical protein